MTEQALLVSIYLLEIIVFQFLTTPLMSRLSYKQALAKNKDWVLENNNIIQKFNLPKPHLSYIAGLLLIILLGYGAYTSNSGLLSLVNFLSALTLVIHAFGIDFHYSKKIKNAIPEPSIKEASLRPRVFSAYISVNKKNIMVGLSVLAAVLWLAIFITQKGNLTKVLIKDFVSSFILIISFFAVLVYTIKRSPLKATKAINKFYRLSEIKFLYYFLILFLIRSIYLGCIYFFESFNHESYHSILNNLIYTLIPLIAFMWFCTDKKIKELANENFISSKS